MPEPRLGYTNYFIYDTVIPAVSVSMPPNNYTQSPDPDVFTSIQMTSGTVSDTAPGKVGNVFVSVEHFAGGANQVDHRQIGDYLQLSGQFGPGQAWIPVSTITAQGVWQFYFSSGVITQWILDDRLDGEDYMVTAQSFDKAGNPSLVSSYKTFRLTPPRPQSIIQSQQSNTFYQNLSLISGTASKQNGPVADTDYVLLQIQRQSDNKYYNVYDTNTYTYWVGFSTWIMTQQADQGEGLPYNWNYTLDYNQFVHRNPQVLQSGQGRLAVTGFLNQTAHVWR